ncbi:serine/threonine-protein kinase [Nonomuraea sp. NBC_01738]|uniref:serine/threonine-protein kinase n=1 Tax=Nonomuraea sp. NBC_01738 TaxID=2976003 RepID=UPI002E0E2AA9|nr:serine/threonine-protein kinase [Nonomuraea sp. NBC_01738]
MSDLVFGGYRVVRPLGEGGQGAVYLAEAPEGGLVAVKVLHANIALEPAERRRFERELEAARKVARFCTARVLDADVHAERPYVVSEYVEGESLQQKISRDGPLPGPALERVAVGTAAALAAIHKAGIVHRDFKPGDVLLGPDGPRVIDFGIAAVTEGSMTTSHALMGTPMYMSPEQIGGDRPGPPSDLFSWAGTVLYAATGAPPFGGDSVTAILQRVMSEQPDVGALPSPLREVVADCLRKDPAARPTAPDVLLRMVGETELVELPATITPPRRPSRRLLYGAAATVAVVAVAATVVGLTRDDPAVTTTNSVKASETPENGTSATPSDDSQGSASAILDRLGPVAPNAVEDEVEAIGTLDGRPVMLGSAPDEPPPRDRELRLWDLTTLRATGVTMKAGSAVQGAAITTLKGKAVAVGWEENGGITTWDLKTGARLKSMKIPRPYPGDPEPVVTGKWLVELTNEDAGYFRALDLGTGKVKRAENPDDDGHKEVSFSLAATADGRAVAGYASGRFTAWDPATMRHGRVVRAHDRILRAIAVDGDTVLTGDTPPLIKISTATMKGWDLGTGKSRHTPITTRNKGFARIAVLGDLAVTLGENHNDLWNLKTGKSLGKVPFEGMDVKLTVVAGRTVALFADDGATSLWNLSLAGLTT